MLVGIRLLEQAGASCITIGWNTVHHWTKEISVSPALPVLHSVDAVMLEIRLA
jgi:aspartate racemase